MIITRIEPVSKTRVRIYLTKSRRFVFIRVKFPGTIWYRENFIRGDL